MIYLIQGSSDGITVYEQVSQSQNKETEKIWIKYSSKATIVTSQHVMRRLRYDIGYGRCFLLVYEKSTFNTEANDVLLGDDLKEKINQEKKKRWFPIPQLKMRKETITIAKDSQRNRI